MQQEGDAALEGFAGWCRRCRHPVRPDAEGRRRCPECGLDAGLVVDVVRTLRTRRRAATWLAWSLIGLGALLWLDAWQGLSDTAAAELWHRWYRTAWNLSPLRSIIEETWSWTTWLNISVTSTALLMAVASVASAHAAGRLLTRAVACGCGVALAIGGLAYALAVLRWPLDFTAGDPFGLVGPSSGWPSDIPKWVALVLRLVEGPGALLAFAACGAVLVRRWHATPARGCVVAAIALLAVAAVAWSVWQTTLAAIHTDLHAAAADGTIWMRRHRTLLDRLFAIQSHDAWTWSLRGVVTAGLALLGWLLVASGHGIRALARPPSTREPARPSHRSGAAMVAGAAVLAAVVAVAVVVAIEAVEPQRPDAFLGAESASALMERRSPVTTAVAILLQVLFAVPLIVGAVRGSWRAALAFMTAAIGAAALAAAVVVGLQG